MEIRLPGQPSSGYESLKGSDIKEALNGEIIKPVLVREESDVVAPSYMLDMSDVPSVTEDSLKAIKGMLRGGDTAVYIRNNNVMALIGYGDSIVLYSVLTGLVKHLYSGMCKVYFNNGSGFKAVREMDVHGVRLKL